jgi:hypothetical protein
LNLKGDISWFFKNWVFKFSLCRYAVGALDVRDVCAAAAMAEHFRRVPQMRQLALGSPVERCKLTHSLKAPGIT